VRRGLAAVALKRGAAAEATGRRGRPVVACGRCLGQPFGASITRSQGLHPRRSWSGGRAGAAACRGGRARASPMVKACRRPIRGPGDRGEVVEGRKSPDPVARAGPSRACRRSPSSQRASRAALSLAQFGQELSSARPGWWHGQGSARRIVAQRWLTIWRTVAAGKRESAGSGGDAPS